MYISSRNETVVKGSACSAFARTANLFNAARRMTPQALSSDCGDLDRSDQMDLPM